MITDNDDVKKHHSIYYHTSLIDVYGAIDRARTYDLLLRRDVAKGAVFKYTMNKRKII